LPKVALEPVALRERAMRLSFGLAGRRHGGRIRVTTDPERTIRRNGEHEIDIRKSRFICTLVRVRSEGEARAAIEVARKRFWDANHNCTAWRIGPGGASQRSSDDGEPSGTAGVPMLETLRQRDLTDVLAIVTRYFGGTKLGAGGLIRAYGSAVSEAIDAVGIVERRPFHIVAVDVPHAEAGRFEHALRASVYALQEVAYNASEVTFTLRLAPADLDPCAAWLAETTAGQAVMVELGVEFAEVAI